MKKTYFVKAEAWENNTYSWPSTEFGPYKSLKKALREAEGFRNFDGISTPVWEARERVFRVYAEANGHRKLVATFTPFNATDTWMPMSKEKQFFGVGA